MSVKRGHFNNNNNYLTVSGWSNIIIYVKNIKEDLYITGPLHPVNKTKGKTGVDELWHTLLWEALYLCVGNREINAALAWEKQSIAWPFSLKGLRHWASLMAQWLRICLPMQRVQNRSSAGELGSHMLHGQKKRKRKEKVLSTTYTVQVDWIYEIPWSGLSVLRLCCRMKRISYCK